LIVFFLALISSVLLGWLYVSNATKTYTFVTDNGVAFTAEYPMLWVATDVIERDITKFSSYIQAGSPSLWRCFNEGTRILELTLHIDELETKEEYDLRIRKIVEEERYYEFVTLGAYEYLYYSGNRRHAQSDPFYGTYSLRKDNQILRIEALPSSCAEKRFDNVNGETIRSVIKTIQFKE
jgi:hypothetical protein